MTAANCPYPPLIPYLPRWPLPLPRQRPEKGKTKIEQTNKQTNESEVSRRRNKEENGFMPCAPTMVGDPQSLWLGSPELAGCRLACPMEVSAIAPSSPRPHPSMGDGWVSAAVATSVDLRRKGGREVAGGDVLSVGEWCAGERVVFGH